MRLGEITVAGNTAYDSETIEKYLLGPTRERFPRIRNVLRLPYVDVDIRSGADLVRRLYAADGYLDAEVSDPEPNFSDDETVANISLKITEGIQYRFGTIKFDGPLVFPREDLLAAVAEQTKNIFTPGRLLAAERALEDYYRQRGYFTATVRANGDPMEAKDGVVPVTIQLQPGIKYFFDGVAVTGNEGVKTAFIQRRLASMSGQVYDPSRVDRGFRELIDTGLFRNVRITPTPVNGNQLRLDVAVDEAKPREFGVGVGYATYDGGIVSLSYADRNLFHTGRPLTIEAKSTSVVTTGRSNTPTRGSWKPTTSWKSAPTASRETCGASPRTNSAFAHRLRKTSPITGRCRPSSWRNTIARPTS